MSINEGWKFHRWKDSPDGIVYDHRPDKDNLTDVIVLMPWIMPSGNNFIADPADRHDRLDREPDIDIPYVGASFDDNNWETVSLPHDWAIAGPFVSFCSLSDEYRDQSQSMS